MRVVVALILPDLVERVIGELSVQADSTPEFFAMAALHFGGFELSDGLWQLADNLKVYDRVTERFLDRGRSFQEQGVQDGHLLMITFFTDKTVLNKKISYRELSGIDKAEAEILHGR